MNGMMHPTNNIYNIIKILLINIQVNKVHHIISVNL